MTLAGITSATLASNEISYDLENGFTTVLNYEGNETSIKQLAQQSELVGQKYDLSHDGPLWKARLTYGTQIGGGGSEQPVDKWEIDTDYIQEDIYANQNVFKGASYNYNVLSDWKKRIKDALDNDKTPDASGFEEPLLTLYKLILRGATAHEIKRPLLIRRRTISIYYSPRFKVDPVEKFYKTSALVNSFGIPAAIQSQLPDDPSNAPSGTAWGWKMRKHTSDYLLNKGKVVEELEWVYAAWSTFLYDFVTS